MNEIVYAGLTRALMVYKIHMETDTSSWCYNATDEELIDGYKEIFEETA